MNAPVEQKSRRSAITVHSIEFASKTALITHIRYILSKYEPGSCVLYHELRFLKELVKRHPNAVEIIGCGIDKIQVYLPEIWIGTRSEHKGLRVIRCNGSIASFSYLQCITPKTLQHNFSSAARRAIAHQIVEFSEKSFGQDRAGTVFSVVDNRAITWAEHHVDHHPLPFCDILAGFIDEYKIDVASIDYTQPDSGKLSYLSRLACPKLSLAWQKYHAAHAQLRCISKEANLKFKKSARRKES